MIVLKKCLYEECDRLLPDHWKTGMQMSSKEYEDRMFCDNECSCEQRQLTKRREQANTIVEINLSYIDLYNAGRIKEIANVSI